MKILLEKNRSVSSSNKENHIDSEFFVKERLLPNEDISDVFSLYDQYNKEIDECTRFRILLTLNSVCTNALFNVKTEININEGKLSDDCVSIIDNGVGVGKLDFSENSINTTSPITHLQAIRDTEYSHVNNGNFSYNCGVDIFNNHIIRSKNFVHVNEIGEFDGNYSHYEVYNTIKDYIRNSKGEPIKNNFNMTFSGGTDVDSHLYDSNSLLDLKEAFNEKCREKDGWWGFVNKGFININTSSSDTTSVNMVLNNKKVCEFVDLYPDRTLFSFIPKYNNYQKRIEKNWDYCITYPYENDYELVDTICGGQKQAIKCDIKRVVNTSSIEMLQCKCIFKHNLNIGDSINIYYYTYGGTSASPIYCYSSSVKVVSLGDGNGDFNDRIFNIRYQDIKTIYDYLDEFGFYFKKVVANTECSYYFRKFKKIKTYNGEDLKSDINKVGFSENIYGDNVSQVIFTDDVDVEGLVDNNGRPLSEIYFTVVKRHKGNDLWYRLSDGGPVFSSPEIEYSHCFGKVTSGLDFSGIGDEEEPFDYNVHRLHNLDINDSYVQDDEHALNTFAVWGVSVSAMPLTLEDDITIDFDWIYGDVVEMDNYNYTETVISNVYHRFNTQQRESFLPWYKNIYKDVIVNDDYDRECTALRDDFVVATYYLNDYATNKTEIGNESNTLTYGNIMPEGYCYNPNTKIKIREEEERVIRSTAKYINYDICSINGRVCYSEYKIINGERHLIRRTYDIIPSWYRGKGGNRTSDNDNQQDYNYYETSIEGYILSIRVPINYGFIKGDYIAFYDKESGRIVWGEITSFSEEDMTLKIYFSDNAFDYLGADILLNEDYFYPENLNRRFFAFWTSDSVPLYATFSLNTRKFCWKMLKRASKLDSNDDLYNTTFTNGRFYIHKNVNFFLKRQDPQGKYGLSVPIYSEESEINNNPMMNYVIGGYNRVDLSQFNEIIHKTQTCY